jgi:CRISPR-associated protein Cmr5
MIKSKEQERAKKAWDLVNSVPNTIIDNYAALAKSTPVMILTNGLGQTLAFFISKAKSREYSILYDHLNQWLSDNVVWSPNEDIDDTLIERIINENSQGYRMATEEALAFLLWIKRFATALSKEVTE